MVRCSGRAAALLALALGLSWAAAQAGTTSPGLVVGGSYAIAAGQTVRGDLTAIGASVVVESGATLDGSLTAVGGNTVVDGRVSGSVHAYGGALALGDGAHVLGDVASSYAVFEPAPGAVVAGTIQAGQERPVQFSFPANVRLPADVASRALVSRHPTDGILRAIGLGLVAAMLMAAIPLRMGRVRDAMLRRPARSGLDGLLTLLVVVVVLVLLAVTLVGIPLAILGGMLLYATVLFGWVAFGDAVGAYLASAFKQEWRPWLRAGVGACALSLALAVLEVVPVVGGLVGFVLALVALGAVRSTRFGARALQRSEPGRPSAPSPQGG